MESNRIINDFRIVTIGSRVFDYPRHLPVPDIGATLLIGAFGGVVTDVRFNIMSENMSEIKIVVEDNGCPAVDAPGKSETFKTSEFE